MILPNAYTLTWTWALVGGLGVLFLVYALAFPTRRLPRRAIPDRDRYAGAGWAYGLAQNTKPDKMQRVERLLKAANWFWAPGDVQPPRPNVPFYSARGCYATALYRALALGAVGLIGGAGLAFGAGLPLWAAPGIGLLLGYVGYLGPFGQLEAAVKERQYRMQIEMAFRLPELAAIVSSGKSILQALRTLTERPGGPLATELARLLRLYDATTSLETAANAVVEHNRFPPLTEFLRQILMVELRGGTIAPTLNVQAETAQANLQRRLLEQGLANAGAMEMPVLVTSLLVMMGLIAGPAIWYLMQYL